MTNYCRSSVRAYLLAIAATMSSPVTSSSVSSSLQINLPEDLLQKGGYEHREALFGVPPYGGSIQQKIYYTYDNLCSGPVSSNHFHPPFILMVDRGHCTFVQKVRNAQHSGAMAVIIADNTCQCKHQTTCELERGEKCEENEPIMANDGSGNDITIPSMLMFKQDADPVKAALHKGDAVRAELAWSVPNPDDHVEYELWTSPSDFTMAEFNTQWIDAAMELDSTATFTPHMYLYDGIKDDCRGKDGKSVCQSLCTNEGRYCAIDPDGDLNAGISGANVVEESLRRLCIWDLYGKENGIGLEYWEYLKQFAVCDTTLDFMESGCVEGAMMRANVNTNSVDACMFDSGGLEEPSTNRLLEENLDMKEKKGVIIMPSAYVNDVPIRGALDFDVLLKAVCAGYKDGTAPDMCLKCANCLAGEHDCIVNNFCPSDAHGGIKTNTFILSLLGMAASFSVLLALVQHRGAQGQLRSQPYGLNTKYMKLEPDKSGETAIEMDDDDDDGVKLSTY